MNVLFFVMSMLMLLALMTYGRLESYLGYAFVQTQFKEYMEKTERNYVNEEAKERYDKEKGSTKDNSNSSKRNQASPKLSLSLFIDKEEREKQLKDLEVQRNIAKNLMYFLYGEQPFFLQMEEKRPDFLNEILNALIKVTEDYNKDQKLNSNKVEEISTVDLGDVELNEVFTKMLKGTPELTANTNPSKGNQTAQERKYAFKPDNGYYSLLEFITIQKNKNVIRVYLAPPQLLVALYGNVDVVNRILDARNQIYYNLTHSNKDQASEISASSQAQFQAEFQNQRYPWIPIEMLDFGVSKTKPPKS